MNNEILHRIEQRLKALDLSREAASKKAGLERSYLRKLFEQKVSPLAKSLEKLAIALETDVNWLMTGQSDSRQAVPQTRASDVIDHKLLELALTVIQQGLRENKRQMSPADHAKLVLSAYDILSHNSDASQQESIIRLVGNMR